MTVFKVLPASLAALIFSVVQVSAHGIADGITVYSQGAGEGTYYMGYNPSFQYMSPPPEIGQWSTPDDLQNGFIDGTKYANPDIVCHLGASNADLEIPVNGGDEVAIHWNTWPDSHKGPIIDALAKCDDSCQTVDKTTLKFFKISEVSQIDKAQDFWAPNELIKNNFTWFVKIPKDIEPGNYVLRHEIIALHAAGQPNGAQNYPFCYNLAISTAGSDKAADQGGIELTKWYKSSDNGIVWDLFSHRNDDYPIVGPHNLYKGALVASQRMPKIMATGKAVMSLDVASLPKPTAVAAASPAVEEEPEPVSAPKEPNMVTEGGVVKVYSTVVLTTLVTETVKAVTTMYTTVHG